MGYKDKEKLKIAVQKNGRLSQDSLDLLRKADLDFGTYKRKLFSSCRNFPLDVLYVRDDDIPGYVSSGTADIGIVGQNVLYEERPEVKKLLNLRYGFCSLVVAVPKESKISTIEELQEKTIATTYPKSTTDYFGKYGMSVKTVKINGSVEIAPSLGIAAAIVDLMSTGSTLTLNDLRPMTKIYDSEAVLIANKKISKEKRILLKQLLTRFKSILSAQSYKYVTVNLPQESLPKIKKIIASAKSVAIFPLSEKELVSLQIVIKGDIFWETIQKLKNKGAQNIFVLPVEKAIF
jgi:ATP phosphoribosyltransferase